MIFMAYLASPTKPRGQPIHRWENGFELYGLPELPKRTMMGPGALGLIGGAGKTTALLILAGRLDPSCGWYSLLKKYDADSSAAAQPRHGKNSSPPTSAHYTRTSEACSVPRKAVLSEGNILADILRKLDGDELVTSYKPQAVERLRHLDDFHKDLSDLKLEFDIMHTLRLGGYDRKKIDQLDASELQRISIAAALSKDADLYLFDCPSDHLDIVQRRYVAKLIKERGQRAPVIVADNDIAFLRWACDSTSIFYGDDKWAMPSHVYGAKEGISAFIEGVLPEEKLRIRARGKSGENPAERAKRFAGQHDLLMKIAVQKHFGENVLHADCEIVRNERIGLISSEGFGKSTLMKIIAGKEEKFSGMIKGEFTVSYKPQHLPQRAVLKGLPNETLKALGIPLRGHPTLSASLRQRIAIARCLGAEADVYVLDQPSDGLTVEQRLAVAELLRAKPNVILADHDAWLVARTSDRCGLIVRKGGHSHVEWMSAEDAIERVIKA